MELELVDTSTEAGQATLREVSPIWKVPAATLNSGDDRELVLDSTVICQALLRHEGPGPLAPFDPHELHALNLLHVIDGALDALINLFYLGKDEVGPTHASYLAKQRDRATSACTWLESQANDESLSGHPLERPHLVDIALATTVGWMNCRNTYPIADHPKLCAIHDRLMTRPSVANTAPPAA